MSKDPPPRGSLVCHVAGTLSPSVSGHSWGWGRPFLPVSLCPVSLLSALLRGSSCAESVAGGAPTPRAAGEEPGAAVSPSRAGYPSPELSHVRTALNSHCSP